jgi:HSP20 family protein
MWAEACELLARAERLQREAFRLGPVSGSTPAWEPPVDVCDDGQELHIEIALPGVAPDRIEVSVERGTIHVRADRPLPAWSRRGSIRRLEIPYGRFERWIELPAGQFELGRRELANGCFQLVLRRI